MGPLRVKFWGTRGLISSPRQTTAIFGGNTPCVQILYRQHLILIDTGFGSTNLGDELMHRIIGGGEALTVHILYTHFHWDHIQGLPFFKPIYFPSTSLHLYSPEPTGTMLSNLDILFDGSYSPFQSLLSMQAKTQLHQLAGRLELDGLTIDYHPVDHGASMHAAGVDTYAYKITGPEQDVVCLITDHEARRTQRNKALIDWAKDCSILIHDAQFTPEEYAQKVGWGHSSVTAALNNALRINPGLTLLTHHDPSRNDRDIMEVHRTLISQRRYRGLNFDFAREETMYAATPRKALPKAG